MESAVPITEIATYSVDMITHCADRDRQQVWRQVPGASWRVLVVIAVLVAGLGCIAPAEALPGGEAQAVPATEAEPTAVPPDPAGTGLVEVPLGDLGVDDEVVLAGDGAVAEVPVPVPAGMTLVALTATVAPSGGVEGGWLQFDAGGAAHDVSLDAGDPRAVEVPLAASTVGDDGQVVVRATASFDGPDGTCVTSDRAQVVLGNLEVRYSGVLGAPVDVGSFLVPAPARLTVILPSLPSASEAAAALRLVAAEAAGRPHLDVVVSASEPSGVPRLLDRVVRIDSHAPAGARIVDDAVPTLEIGGKGERLLAEVDTVTGPLAPVLVEAATTGTAVIDDNGRETLRHRMSVADLGLTPLRSSGVGHLTLRWTVSQSALGAQAEAVDFQISGRHSAVADGETARLSLAVDGIILASEELGDGDRFRINAEVGADRISRDMGVELVVAHAPVGGDCRRLALPFELQVDPASAVTVTEGAGVPAGFTRFPQALLKGATVTIKPLDVDGVHAAAVTLAALARGSATPTPVELVDDPARASVVVGSAGLLEDATRSTDGDRDADEDDQVGPPVVVQDGELMAAPAGSTLALGSSPAVLAAWDDGGRDRLALVGGSAANRSRLAGAIAAQPGGFLDLAGDLALLDGADAVRTAAVASDARPASVSAEGVHRRWWPRAIVLGGLLAVVGLALALMYPRVVRRGDG